MGTKGLEIRKPGGTKFRITDEDKEIMLSVLFNDPNFWLYQKHLESEVTGKVSVLQKNLTFQSVSNISRGY